MQVRRTLKLCDLAIVPNEDERTYVDAQLSIGEKTVVRPLGISQSQLDRMRGVLPAGRDEPPRVAEDAAAVVRSRREQLLLGGDKILLGEPRRLLVLDVGQSALASARDVASVCKIVMSRSKSRSISFTKASSTCRTRFSSCARCTDAD